ncbi:MAG: ADP-ribosylglycohydrolase family protein [Cytophagales bacterium]|nr:ADP-ribosylglycohydrolase family protein [Cytophagales bacterium]MCA6382365.1 ADP-ribosylglycohydrolase family protein [Cytophagales bacterium]
MTEHHIISALFGLSVGDALGVPFEFKSRQLMRLFPATNMSGHGTYNLPSGTFSDDSSLSFCLAESLVNGLDINDLRQKFINWRYYNYWSARGNVFDVGISTAKAIDKLAQGVSVNKSGGTTPDSNGNGSLMRILPLVFIFGNEPIEERLRMTKQVSSITHAHELSVVSCFYYLEFARAIIAGREKFEVYEMMKKLFSENQKMIGLKKDCESFDRLIKGDIFLLNEEDIKSSGYVIDTLEASIWCFLTTQSYAQAVLKAVNLGEDTDTTATVTGGLAGLYYGFGGIPENWVEQLAMRQEIESLVERLRDKV